MSAALATRFFTFSNESISQKGMAIAFERLFTKNKCLNATILTLPYPISPNDVHLYEDQLQMNINVFSFFDDEGRARHPMVISRKNYERKVNLLYWRNTMRQSQLLLVCSKI